MTLQNGETLWKLLLGLVFLVFFLCLGIAHTVSPDRFMRRSGMRKGGKMLTEFNRDGTRIVGVIVSIFSACLIYMLLSDVFAR